MKDLTLDDLAALDALGILPEAESACLHRLLAHADAAAAEDALRYREAAVSIAESLEPVHPPPSVKASILAAVRGPQALDESAPAAELSRTLRVNEGEWKTLGVPGVRLKRLSADRERKTVTILLQIDAGTVLPAHDHHGAEDSFVVSGSCRIGSVALSKGDFHHVDAGAHHGNVVSDEGCVLLMVVDYDDFRAA